MLVHMPVVMPVGMSMCMLCEHVGACQGALSERRVHGSAHGVCIGSAHIGQMEVHGV